jgi:endoglucanase
LSQSTTYPSHTIKTNWLWGIGVAAAIIVPLAMYINSAQTGNKDNGISAAEVVTDITVGWNLGNTLDAHPGGGFSTANVRSLETAWVRTATTQATIDAVCDAGFNAIRIPVTWCKVSDPSDHYKIRADWMARVKQIVDYAAAREMYIIINTHHDETLFKFSDADMAKSPDIFEQIWKQIAEAFKDYDEKLMFEALNEPRTRGSPAEWRGGTAMERNNLNTYYQLFVDIVRASGGNNHKRILVLNTYAASAEASAMNGLKLPRDTAKDKIIVSYHAYSPYDFALNMNADSDKGSVSTAAWSKNNTADTQAITSHLNRAQNTFISKGIPVIIGEFGAMNKNSNTAARAEWTEFYVQQAKARGIPCFWWDNGAASGRGELFGILDRAANTFTYPEIIDALIRGIQ